MPFNIIQINLESRFKHPVVRDLAWVIASPPLVSGEYKGVHWWDNNACIEEYKACLPKLIQLDNEPSPLVNYLASLKSGRLGMRFEALIAFWLDISPNYTRLAQNIQVIENKQTFGEIDFVIRDNKRNKVIHLEVAVKFYLGIAPLKDPYRWFGTNTNDQLGRKLDHLKNHQTQLSIHYKDYLEKRLNIRIDKRQCIIKGRLFYPEKDNTPPQGISENHLTGRWTQENIPVGKAGSSNAFIPITKKDWLASMSKETIIKHEAVTILADIGKPLCYVQIDQETMKESGRVFKLPQTFWRFDYANL